MKYLLVLIVLVIMLSACNKNENPDLLRQFDIIITELERMKEIIDDHRDELIKARTSDRDIQGILGVDFPILKRWVDKFHEKFDELIRLAKENENELSEETNQKYVDKATALLEHVTASFNTAFKEYFYEDFFGKYQLKTR